MPIREYRCEHCGQRFETLVLRSEDEMALTCPKCHGGAIRRVMSVCTGLLSKSGTGASRTASNGGCGTCSSGSCSSCH